MSKGKKKYLEDPLKPYDGKDLNLRRLLKISYIIGVLPCDRREKTSQCEGKEIGTKTYRWRQPAGLDFSERDLQLQFSKPGLCVS